MGSTGRTLNTMVTLVLVRHAKSDWGVPNLADHDRPLNERGERDAPIMAEGFGLTSTPIDRIFSSTALRARSTAAHFGRVLGREVELDPELYGAWPRTLIHAVEASMADSVMIVAHNPGLSELAEQLSRGELHHMPPCAVATFTWHEDDWYLVDWDRADYWRIDTPR